MSSTLTRLSCTAKHLGPSTQRLGSLSRHLRTSRNISMSGMLVPHCRAELSPYHGMLVPHCGTELSPYHANSVFATELFVNELKQPEIKDEKQGGEWADFSVEKWRDTVYTSKSYFEQLFIDTTDFIGEFCDELGGKNEDGPLLIEVGCGTGEALEPLFSRAKYACGMDFNPNFIEYCNSQVPPQHRDSVRHFQGDAQKLDSLLQSELPAEWNIEGRKKIVVCVGNTIGIMPPAVRRNVYEKMKEIAGKEGYFVIVYWNGNTFGDAVQNFYHKNPQLCGKFAGSSIDLDSCTLTTPSGYCTHWTKPEEARTIFEEEIDAEVVQLLEKGNGVLVAGRMRA